MVFGAQAASSVETFNDFDVSVVLVGCSVLCGLFSFDLSLLLPFVVFVCCIDFRSFVLSLLFPSFLFRVLRFLIVRVCSTFSELSSYSGLSRSARFLSFHMFSQFLWACGSFPDFSKPSRKKRRRLFPALRHFIICSCNTPGPICMIPVPSPNAHRVQTNCRWRLKKNF